MKFSKRTQLLKPSPTLALANLARELAAKGNDVVSLTVGEPDWATFPAIKSAAIEAIQKDFTKYTASNGIIELREAIANNLSKEIGITYKPNQIAVGTGAKYIIYALLQLLIDDGDEVLIPAPYWVSYPTMVELAGGVPKIIECGEVENFKLTAAKLKSAISSKTKALILCSPSNPTGLSYTKQELTELVSIFKENPNLIVLSDDIYNRLVFSTEFVAPHILQIAPELQGQVIPINGASKSMSMTGWRVGWAAGPADLMQLMNDFLSQSTSNLSSISQKATLAGLQKCEPDMKLAREKLIERKTLGMNSFEKLKYFKAYEPQGAFYFWVNVKGTFGKSFKGENIQSSSQVAKMLLNHFFVATVPGEEFGSPGHLRMSFATSDANMKKAFDRFKDFETQLT
jgi:aspartate aminotransferase